MGGWGRACNRRVKTSCRLILAVCVLLGVASCSSGRAAKHPLDAAANADIEQAVVAEVTTPGDVALPSFPQIAVIPPQQVDFGDLVLGASAERQVKICNHGNAALHIGLVSVTNSQPGVLAVTVAAPATQVVAADPGDSCDGGVLLTLTATANLGTPTSTVASRLWIASDDPTMPVRSLDLRVHGLAPHLQVLPPGVVDFSYVGLGTDVTRAVTLHNDGHAPLAVKSVAILGDSYGEFSLIAGGFPPVAVPPSDGEVLPGDSAVFAVRFSAKGPIGKKSQAKLYISTNDPTQATVVLLMVATAFNDEVCAVAVPSLDFGAMGWGQSKTLPLILTNVGSGPCQFKQVNVLDCSFNGLTPQFGPVPLVCKAQASKVFSAGAPSAGLFDLAPGASGTVQVTCHAPQDLGILLGQPGTATPLGGLLVATFAEATTGAGLNFPVSLSQAPTTSANLQAVVGSAQLDAIPAVVGFGDTPTTCPSTPALLTLVNDGNAPVVVTKVATTGCGAAIKLLGAPVVPPAGLTLAPKEAYEDWVQAAPQQVGPFSCEVQVATAEQGKCRDNVSNAVVAGDCQSNANCSPGQYCGGFWRTVEVTGNGVAATNRTDGFVIGASKQVDVLLVIDNSASMLAYQAKLAAALPELMALGDAQQVNYHFGVVTTDMANPEGMGKLQQFGGIRVVSPATPQKLAALQVLVKQGEQGSTFEQGLAAAAAALSSTLGFDSSVACVDDKGCAGYGGVCLPEADTPTLLGCGGVNRGFLRPQAALEVIVLSDDNDYSPKSVASYLSAMATTASWPTGKVRRLHALVAPAANCPAAAAPTAVGTRYLDAATATGGLAATICDADYSAFMAQVGALVFGTTPEVALTALPLAGTIAVNVAGKPCPATAWKYQANGNRVILDSPAACAAVSGAAVTVTYQLACGP